jgi:hypothetical protein
MKPHWFIFLILLLISCNAGKRDIPPIAVGMTYDEVEKLVGKPKEIRRGANELDYSSLESLTLDELNVLDIDSAKSAVSRGDSSVWAHKKEVKTIGSLIYVTWVFEKYDLDTNYVFKKLFRMVKDTVTETAYYLNDHKVSKRNWDKADIHDYMRTDYQGDAEMVTFGGRDRGQYNLGYERIDTKTKRPVSRIVEYKTASGSAKEYYQVTKEFCITFDASSGRVVTSGYQPVAVVPIR